MIGATQYDHFLIVFVSEMQDNITKKSSSGPPHRISYVLGITKTFSTDEGVNAATKWLFGCLYSDVTS